MARDFGATNEPRTCLWCGRKLQENRPSFDAAGNFIQPKDRKGDGTFGYDGYFDTRDCGRMFGLALATHGRRLKPRPEGT